MPPFRTPRAPSSESERDVAKELANRLRYRYWRIRPDEPLALEIRRQKRKRYRQRKKMFRTRSKDPLGASAYATMFQALEGMDRVSN